jgi:hypothetical protein
MNKKSILTIALTIVLCVVIILALPTEFNIKVNGNLPAIGVASDSVSQSAQPVATTAPQTTQGAGESVSQAVQNVADKVETVVTGNPTGNKEIIEQYTLLVNKFKQEKPAYKKKEFQSLPEEFRNLGTAGNLILEIASGYITSEEECEELVRAAGGEDIKWDMPIHNSDVGCLLTNYDAVEWAKCEDVGDGTKKISFSLKEEMNCEPTPADTLVPVSNHGAVMQPLSRQSILDEVEKITEKFPIITVNDFSLGYRECVFECVYNPDTNQVKSITHHVVIDINADLKVTLAKIAGSARLYNDMKIYDITW